MKGYEHGKALGGQGEPLGGTGHSVRGDRGTELVLRRSSLYFTFLASDEQVGAFILRLFCNLTPSFSLYCVWNPVP